MPMANSARLHAAMAWKVPMWFCTPHHFGADATARPGSMTRRRGSEVRKYGAFSDTAAENSRVPSIGMRDSFFHVSTVAVGLPVAGRVAGRFASFIPPAYAGRPAPGPVSRDRRRAASQSGVAKQKAGPRAKREPAGKPKLAS